MALRVVRLLIVWLEFRQGRLAPGDYHNYNRLNGALHHLRLTETSLLYFDPCKPNPQIEDLDDEQS